MYFKEDNTIAGANIFSYLLEKSRVVAPALNERSYHIFYALLAGSQLGMDKPNSYRYLSRTQCYEATGIDDKKYFEEIISSMRSIGFQET